MCDSVLFIKGLNSSPDSLNPSQSTSSSSPPTTDSIQPQSLIERFSAKHSSKIPVPVLSHAKNRSRQSLLNANQQRTLKAHIRDSVNYPNGATANNSKVDQIIADLLIEALNHSTDIGIEFIKAEKNPHQSQIKLNQTTKRTTNLNTRRTNGITIIGSGTNSSGGGGGSGGKRSSHGSAKYQQVFDAIPEEEKSASLSIESPNEETDAPETANQTNNSNKSHDKTDIESKTSSSPPKINEISPKQAVNGTQLKVASGKAAIESDQDKSETWFGCFGRTHVDSPSDGLLMDEGIFKIVHSTSLAV